MCSALRCGEPGTDLGPARTSSRGFGDAGNLGCRKLTMDRAREHERSRRGAIQGQQSSIGIQIETGTHVADGLAVFIREDHEISRCRNLVKPRVAQGFIFKLITAIEVKAKLRFSGSPNTDKRVGFTLSATGTQQNQRNQHSQSAHRSFFHAAILAALQGHSTALPEVYRVLQVVEGVSISG